MKTMKIYCLDIHDESCPESTRQRRFTNLRDAKKARTEEIKLNEWTKDEAELYIRIDIENVPMNKKKFCTWMEERIIIGT